MVKEESSIHGMWSSRWAFILAATGSAVGLGNIWKFPYITGENGGGAFVLVYLLCIAVVGIPILSAEVMIGRKARQSPGNAFGAIAKSQKLSPWWKGVGWLGILAGFTILTFYSVVAGWSLAYFFKAGSGAFIEKSPEAMGEMLDQLMQDPQQAIIWTFTVILLTTYVVGRGVHKGLEKAVSTLMPMMFIILCVMVVYAMTTGHFSEGLSFLFTPDFSKITAEGVLIALGHAFFSLSLASGMMAMYGAYVPKEVSLFKTSVAIGLADTSVALLAGMAIFPIVFAYGLEPGQGPGLIFVTLPLAFSQMPGGLIIGALFFLMLVFAAFTSAISLIESSVAWLVERTGLSRSKAALAAGSLVMVISIGPALSFSLLSDTTLFGKTFFDLFDYVTANLMLPIGGLLMAIFVGWQMSASSVAEELNLSKTMMAFRIFIFIIKFIAPVAIALVFLSKLGILN
ncbi:MAG: sodium-dependent transporter [Pseudomonadota bacterium]